MSSAAEARFRVQTPNSKPRAIKVVALDSPSELVVRRVASGDWPRATFLTASAYQGAPDAQGWLLDLEGRPHDLVQEVAGADLFVMVAVPGGRADAAAVVGRACSDRRVNTTGLVIGAYSAPERELSRTLVQLRPWSLMLVIAEPDDYIENMLIALRA